MPVADIKLVEAYRASHPVQAHAIKFALEDAEIRVVIENEALQDGIGDIPCGWSSAPRLLVDESQLAAARAIISQTDHSGDSACDLNVMQTAVPAAAAASGLGIGRFPDRRAESEPTRCLACDAIMEESEAVCPKCGWTYRAVESPESL